ncbi:hypothetical protein [Salana multivorans]
MGSAILAAASGTVTHVSCAWFQGRSPCNMIIDHGTDPATGERVETWYVHMYPAGVFVSVGDVLGAGQHIADVERELHRPAPAPGGPPRRPDRGPDAVLRRARLPQG